MTTEREVRKAAHLKLSHELRQLFSPLRKALHLRLSADKDFTSEAFHALSCLEAQMFKRMIGVAETEAVNATGGD